MSITPGSVIREFTTKSGKAALIRYPQMDDVLLLQHFINTVSLEDTYIGFSGEQQSLESETIYLNSELEKIKSGDCVKLFCIVDGVIAGTCDIHRDDTLFTRRRHSGVFGLIVGSAYRGDGIGETLTLTTIDESRRIISGLRLIKLSCFANNKPAMHLYEKLGFKEVGRIPETLQYKGTYVDEVLMTLPLS